MNKEPKLLTITEFEDYHKNGYTIVDTRPQKEFIEGFIPGSLHIPADEHFYSKALPYLATNQFFCLVTPRNKEAEHYKLIQQAGFTNIIGVLEDGWDIWQQSGLNIDVIVSISPQEFELEFKHGKLFLIDIREPEAFELEHVEGSYNYEKEVLINNYEQLDDKITNCIYCVDGSESLTLISYLKFNGKHNLYHVEGGYSAIRKMQQINFVRPKKKKDNKEKKFDPFGGYGASGN